MKVVVGDVGKNFVEEFAALPSGHWEIMEQVVATILWSGTWDVTLIVGDEAESAGHELHNVAALIVATEQ